MTRTVLDDLVSAGVSIWLDAISRSMVTTGVLRRYVEDRNVVGVTSNPAIFEAAVSEETDYAAQIAQLRASGVGPEAAAEAITVRDVQLACDQLLSVWRASTGRDGRVSLEVDPRSAADAPAMTRQAARLWRLVERPNLMVKIPATDAGLGAISQATAQGISVNVTLVFSAQRYAEVAGAYMEGLEQALANGYQLSAIHSVASFFVSRLDSEADQRLAALGSTAAGLRGTAGLAMAIAAYEHFQETQASHRWLALQRQGAQTQRLLWASTGVKDPAYPQTKYVTGLVAPQTVSTLPQSTLEAAAQLTGHIRATMPASFDVSRQARDALRRAGVDLDDAAATLEREGIQKFVTAWELLLARLASQLGISASSV